jgi:hypothetical protein
MAIRVEANAEAEGDRTLQVRAANDRIAEKAEQLRFQARVPMMCECGDPNCRSLLMIALDEYHAIGEAPHTILTASGHVVDGTDLLKEEPEYDIRRTSPRRRNGDRRLA